MAQMISELHQDHQHISALLTILKNKLALLELGDRPNFNLMAEVVDYLIDYADDYHHCKENIIYNYLQLHYPRHSHLFDQQKKEHEQLRELTLKLRASVDQALLDMPLPMEEFTHQLRSFIDAQCQHLNTEEGKIFPLVEQHLTADDWKQLQASVPARENPLQTSEREQRYKNLYEALIDDLA